MTRRAREVQRLIANKVVIRPLTGVRLVAGLDAAYRGDLAYAVAVVMDVQSMKVVEWRCTASIAPAPYIPTLLALRELTPMARAWLKLSTKPDATLVDGQGMAHPAKAGIATHLGVALRTATIGVAKSRLYGEERGASLIDPDTGEEIGRVINCNTGKAYISVGNLADLDTAQALVEKLCRRGAGGMPAPVWEAHKLANQLRRREPRSFDEWGEARDLCTA